MTSCKYPIVDYLPSIEAEHTKAKLMKQRNTVNEEVVMVNPVNKVDRCIDPKQITSEA